MDWTRVFVDKFFAMGRTPSIEFAEQWVASDAEKAKPIMDATRM
jgi:hypothetical protein